MIKQKKVVSADTLRKRAEKKYTNTIANIFKSSGFFHVKTNWIEIKFKSFTSEIDNIFVYENIVIISEDTISKSSEIWDHLRKKDDFFQVVHLNSADFIQLMIDTYPDFKKIHNDKDCYSCAEYKILYTYCSKNTIDITHKNHHSSLIRFLDNQYVLYFSAITKVIYWSAKYEIFKFLWLDIKDIWIVNWSQWSFYNFKWLILPESPSWYDEDFKIITFYVDPGTLIKLSYVLRKDWSWRDKDWLYQRLLIKSKISNMREYLIKNERVYINNLIVTLPSETKILKINTADTLSQTEIKSIKLAQEISVQVPYDFNQIWIIDWQHRLFSYHEWVDRYEKKIAIKRVKQHLLATGIIFPIWMSDEKKLEFESKLFLEINDKQNKVNSTLKQDIQSIVHPFDDVSIAKAVVNRVSTTWPLVDYLEAHYFDKWKTKTASIVSYWLKHIVKLSATEWLFSIWTHPNKDTLLLKEDKVLLDEYIKYCTEEVNKIFIWYKIKLSQTWMYTLEKDKSRALFATAINWVIFCLRRLTIDKTLYSVSEYTTKLDKLSIDFSPEKFKFKSSHWKDLWDEIYNQCFDKSK